jgi:hypothetical protein
MIQRPDLNKPAMAKADVQALDKEDRLARQEVTESEAPREKTSRKYKTVIMFDSDLADFLREKQP